MARDGVDISGHQSTLVDEYMHHDFDLIWTVCDNARENCPVLPSKPCGQTVRLHHGFADPAQARGNPQEIEAVFDSVRDQIKAYCRDIIYKSNW
jgi:arsenate reductase